MKLQLARMGTLFAAGILTTATTLTPEASAQDTDKKEAKQKVASLDVGSQVPELKGITWLQGDPVATFDEAGKVYMLELWATWCGPCVQIIPHVNELHQKYADKGLVIVGMNVWEDDINTPKKFLADQGDKMSYRVAFSGGSNSDFASTWLKPAGVQGIPHALIMKDGKIIFKGHPGGINHAMIESMLDGSYDPKKAESELQAQQKAAEELRAEVMPLFQKEDWDGVLAIADSLEDSNPAKLQLKITAISQKGDWKALTDLRSEIVKLNDPKLNVSELDQSSALMMPDSEDAKPYAALALKDLKLPEDAESLEEKLHLTLVSSRLNYLAGNLETAQKQIDATIALLAEVEHPQMKQQLGTILPLAKEALSGGKFPSFMELSKQLGQ
ncbi:TlpA disulfide reductase family protein [Rubritalea marina]|uniref:TlpA disulfide reductase family protein n=1 Tax=Rubritalea marina TaxID=361055 RepID=UPI000368F79C|nr:TlpA disulfide reductase family protein [Rubritalea marina]